MKNKLLFLSLAISLLSSCDADTKTKVRSSLNSDTDFLSTTAIEDEIEDCDKSIATYNNLIDKTLSGDAKAMKKLSITKEKIEEELEILEEWSANFSGKQADQFTVLQKKFLAVAGRNFYKILEHFAPLAVNIEAYELMRKKLDTPKSQFENGDFIRSIFDLAISTRTKFNDEDLIKATFITCFDFVGLFDKLPNSIKAKVKKQASVPKIKHSTDQQIIRTASNIVGKVIYLTRNKAVHAKSNFEATGNECANEDLNTLNDFMKEACSQTIRWYNRLPNHLKLASIQ